MDLLCASGLVHRQSTLLLGLFSITVWPTIDRNAKDALRQPLRQVLLDRHRPDDRTPRVDFPATCGSRATRTMPGLATSRHRRTRCRRRSSPRPCPSRSGYSACGRSTRRSRSIFQKLTGTGGFIRSDSFITRSISIISSSSAWVRFGPRSKARCRARCCHSGNRPML
ncbi:GPP34 family phosphoprotein [Nocardia sp. NBC_00565]|uniref:GPP34 family phosphoprotein n=1 Tax=Nocardia sp. NBC_00565 TaxID=2975993 RepID=UPI003FA56B59